MGCHHLEGKPEVAMQDVLGESSVRYLTAKELSGYIKLSIWTIYDMVKRRHIPFIPFGRAVRFDRDAIDKWMSRRLVKSIDSWNEKS